MLPLDCPRRVDLPKPAALQSEYEYEYEYRFTEYEQEGYSTFRFTLSRTGATLHPLTLFATHLFANVAQLRFVHLRLLATISVH